MQDIRNLKDRLVCRADAEDRSVEIVLQGCKTLVRFKPDGTIEIINTKIE